jgi:hypothetical protein
MKFKAAMITVALMATSAAVHADTKKHEGKYCAALTTLGEDLMKLQALGPDSKVGELRSIMDRIDKDARAIEKEGSRIKTPAGKQFVASANRLTNETRSMSDDMTLAQVKSRIEDDVRNVKQSAQALADEAGCPEAVPQMEGSAEATP